MCGTVGKMGIQSLNYHKVIQTGAKIQFGGLKNGFFKVGYHVITPSLVTKLDK